MCILSANSGLVQEPTGARTIGRVRQHLLRTIVLHREAVHPNGFKQERDLEIPYDVVWKLLSLNPGVMLTSELGARTLQAVIYRLVFRSARIIIHADLSEDTERGIGRGRTALRRFLFAHADLVVVNGRSGMRYFLKAGGQPGRVVVVPFATDNVFLTAAPRPVREGPARALLYVGRLIELKGLEPFLQCLVRWSERHPADRIRFTLIGDGPLRASLVNTSRPSNLTIVAEGAVRYESLPNYYRSADLMVFPTLADTWGLVVNEAMAMGLPVLGSIRSQAVTELIEHGVSGWWFDPMSRHDMDQAVDCALQAPPETLSEMAGRARARARQLTPVFVADQFEKAIRYVTEH